MSKYLSIVLGHAVDVLEAIVNQPHIIARGCSNDDLVQGVIDTAMRRQFIQLDPLPILVACLEADPALALPEAIAVKVRDDALAKRAVLQGAHVIDQLLPWLRSTGARELRKVKTADAALNVVRSKCRIPVPALLLSSPLLVRRLALERLRAWVATPLDDSRIGGDDDYDSVGSAGPAADASASSEQPSLGGGDGSRGAWLITMRPESPLSSVIGTSPP
jgi:hypothetical protein